MSEISRRQFLRVIGGTTFAFATFSELERALAFKTSSSGVLVECEGFADMGGWKRDTQFIDQMGGIYLLAHGLGVPVKNARTTADFAQGGTYHVWVRTKDWCPGDWQSPGRFRVHVNGKPMAKTFGESGKDWGWENGGTLEVPAGEAKIELEDLTGFDGRCDAIYFTKDADEIPPNDKVEILRWKDAVAGRQAAPKHDLPFDVVIVGGGMAGCTAALAAESQGLNVALVQDRPLLGGNASSEVRVHSIGTAGRNKKIIGRVDTPHYRNGSEESRQAQEKREREMDASKVHIFRDHRAVGLEMDDGRIASVDARENGTGLITRFRAPVFIDCTGDAWLGQWSGADKSYGRESRNEYNEAWEAHGDLWSPEKPDNRVMGTTVMWNTDKADRKMDFPEVPWAMPVARNHNQTRGDWNWEYSADHLNQIDDAEEIRDHMLRAIFGTFSNAKGGPVNAPLYLTWVGWVGGKRESWRLLGDYVFKQDDATSGTEFEDAVVEETREIDVHYQLNLTGSNVDFRSEALFKKTPRYYIPFRCLYSRNIPNLMMAGRCFSCSHIGLGGPRVMNTCAQMGVAVGYASALCKKYNLDPRAIGKQHIEELRGLIGYA